MQTEPGTIALLKGGMLSVTIGDETYTLSRDDVHTLLFYCRSVPLVRSDEDVQPDGALFITTVIDGHITVHPSGRSVYVVTRAGSFALPFASFQAVARGEAISAPLFPVLPDIAGGVV
jgi:hypothetical protein